jgi:heme-degrading monooxygenase HmoA
MDVMVGLAINMPGFLGVESSASTLDDGRLFKLGVIYWQDMASMAAWRDHKSHVATKKKGRALWYDEHNIRVCEVKAQYGTNLTL